MFTSSQELTICFAHNELEISDKYCKTFIYSGTKGIDKLVRENHHSDTLYIEVKLHKFQAIFYLVFCFGIIASVVFFYL